MDRPGSHAVVLASVLYLLIIFQILSPRICHANEPVAPPRNIAVVDESPAVPEWKELWDKARELVKDGRFHEAEAVYEKFFELKNNVTEAQWEFCKVLFQVRNLEKAEKLIAALLEKNPYRQDYLMLGGEIAYRNGDFQLASRRFGLAYEYNPTSSESDNALTGIARSMKKLGRADLAITLNQQLLTRHPEDISLYRKIAQDAVIVGDLKAARKNYDNLLKKAGIGSVQTATLLEMLEVYGKLDLRDSQINVLEELIKRGEGVTRHRQQLSNIFEEIERFSDAVAQFALLYRETGDISFLRHAGNIAFSKMKRPDKALAFFEEVLAVEGQDGQLARTITQIQKKLAEDFLAIVENGGAEMLWQDLLDITPNRLAIYYEIANLLQEKGKLLELIQVYDVIHANYPANDEISWKLASYLLKAGKLQKALATLNSISDANKDSSFFLSKADVERDLGLEQNSLLSAIKALQVSPDDTGLQIRCLKLAGRMGLVSILEEIYQPLSEKDTSPARDVIIEYLRQLANNSLYTRFFSRLCQARNWYSYLPEYLDQLDLIYVRVLFKQDSGRDAEQLLRLMYVEKRGGLWPLLLLAEKNFADNDLRTAEQWLTIIESQQKKSQEKSDATEIALRIALLRQGLRKSSGEDDFLSQEVKRYFTNARFTESNALSTETRAKLIFEFCGRQEVRSNRQLSDKCSQFIHNQSGFDAVAEAIQVKSGQNAAARKNGGEARQTLNPLVINGHPQVANVLDLAEIEIDQGMLQSARKHLDLLKDEITTASVRAEVLTCRLYLKNGALDEGIGCQKSLTEQFPQENYFFTKYLEANIRKGFSAAGLAAMYGRYGFEGKPEQLAASLIENNQKQDVLLLARLLWGNKEHKPALRVYKRLLSPAAVDVVSSQFNSKKIYHLEYSKDRSFWNSILTLLQAQPDVLQELMAPEFLANNVGSETGTIVSSNFGLYSWQKSVQNEYMARQAIYDKNYYFAEQSYQKLVSEDNGEGLKDLAEIYSRLGKHRKEAKIYETIQNRGEETPEILSSIKRTSLQLSPQNSGELEYSKREGRGGLVDMARSTFASSFLFTPDLNIEARFRYANNNYESVTSDASTGSNSMYGSTTFEIFKGYEVDFGAGTEKSNGGSDFSPLYRLGLKGQLDQFFNAFAFIDRQLVTDTVAAIEQQITEQRVETGLTCETPIGVSFGASILHSDYTGSNNSNQFNAFSSYSIFGDKRLLSLRYDYEYLSGSTDDFLPPEANTTEEPALYWLPSTYNQHKLTMRFKQDFLGYKTKDKEEISYYLVEGGVGYEDNENVIYSGGVEFFLEMDPHFLLNGKFNVSQSSEYEERGLFMSLFYRW